MYLIIYMSVHMCIYVSVYIYTVIHIEKVWSPNCYWQLNTCSIRYIV